MLPRTIGHRLLAAGLRSHVPLARLPLLYNTVKHGYTGVLKKSTGEWNGALLSSVMKVDSVCMRLYASDGRTATRLRRTLIFRSAFTHDTLAPLQASWCGGPSVTTRQIWYFCRVNETVPATLYGLFTLCYCHLFDRKVMCFFNWTTQVHIRLLQRNVLYVVYSNCPGQQDTQIYR